jgi:hypothetical protein
MKLKSIIIIVLVLALVGTTAVFAGNPAKRGQAGAAELLMPVGARGTSLGGSSLSLSTGVEAINWNPAGLGIGLKNQNGEVMFSQMNYIADINLSYFALGMTVGDFGTLAFSLRGIDFGAIPVTTEDLPDGTGDTYSPSYLTIGLTYSKQLTDRIAVGFTTKLVSESIVRSSAVGVAFDAGVIYSVSSGDLEGLKFGIALKNLGPNMSFTGADLERPAIPPGSEPQTTPIPMSIVAQSFELPATYELGASYEVKLDEMNKFSISGTFQNSNFGNDVLRSGFEYSFQDMVFLRAGYQTPDQDKSLQIYGLSYGGGVHYNLGGVALGFDYSYNQVEYFDAIHTFTVKLGF